MTGENGFFYPGGRTNLSSNLYAETRKKMV